MSQLDILKSSEKKKCPICAKGKKRIQLSFIHKAEATAVGLKENVIPD